MTIEQLKEKSMLKGSEIDSIKITVYDILVQIDMLTIGSGQLDKQKKQLVEKITKLAQEKDKYDEEIKTLLKGKQ